MCTYTQKKLEVTVGDFPKMCTCFHVRIGEDTKQVNKPTRDGVV